MDLLTHLAGLRNELSQSRDADHAAAVRDEIKRVAALAKAEIEAEKTAALEALDAKVADLDAQLAAAVGHEPAAPSVEPPATPAT